jgi:hypothetical protein
VSLPAASGVRRQASGISLLVAERLSGLEFRRSTFGPVAYNKRPAPHAERGTMFPYIVHM